MDFFYRSPVFEPPHSTDQTNSENFPQKKMASPVQTAPITGEFMKKLNATIKKLTSNQKGQGVMEYVIISSLVGIVCITAVKGFGGVIKERVNDMKSSIVQNIKNQ